MGSQRVRHDLAANHQQQKETELENEPRRSCSNLCSRLVTLHLPNLTKKEERKKSDNIWDFRGGPVVKFSSSNAGGSDLNPGPEAKTLHASQPKNQNINRGNTVANSIKILKMVHIKKKKKNFK